MEGFTFNKEDAQRHVMQVIQEWRKDIGGPEVASRWLSDICAKWRLARCRLKEDGGVQQWRVLIKGVYTDLKATLKVIKYNGVEAEMEEVSESVARGLARAWQ